MSGILGKFACRGFINLLTTFYVLRTKIMPISASAKKSLRSSLRKRIINDARRKTMRETVKNVVKLAKDNKAEAKKKLAAAYQALDKAVKRGVMKKNTASRKKSRPSKMTK